MGRNTGTPCAIDTSNIQIYYAFCASDIRNEDTYRDLFSLEIGKKNTKFYSQYLVKAEEDAKIWSKAHPKADSAPFFRPKGKYHNGWSEYQYSQWFISDDTLTEYSCFPRWLGKYNCYHKERYPEQIWEIASDTMTVCGQLCQKAVCRFRGRDYAAWFTPNIPIPYGPWKFGGLPGVILKVSDKDNLYSFECVRISTTKKTLFKDDYILHVNPTGKFVIGGPHGDTGLTGRKIIVDTYGGKGAHGGGAFSGKDPSKVDRSAAYAARHIAKNMVAAGIAREVLVQVSYAIGIAQPLSIYVDTYGTANVAMSDGEIAQKIGSMFDLRPAAIVSRFGLNYPIFEATASYGHFGRRPYTELVRFIGKDGKEFAKEVEFFSWEKLDEIDRLKQEFGL